MTPSEAAELALQLKKARKAEKPYYFYFLRKGSDGQPVLIVERKQADVTAKGRRAKAAALKKQFASGRVERLEGGAVGFYGEGQVTAAQMGKDFREKLARVSELSAISQLFKQAEIGDLADAPSLASEDEDVRGKAGRLSKKEEGGKEKVDPDEGDDGQVDDAEEGEETPPPTQEDWDKAVSVATALYVAVKAKFGEDSEQFSSVKEAQQRAVTAKKKQLEAGIEGIEDLIFLAKQLLGELAPPTWDWERTNAQLQLAKKSSRPYWFWFCRQGEDDLPILVIERKAQAATAAAKGARRTAKKKKAVSGWVTKSDEGALTFYCSSADLPFAQLEKDFKQKLAKLEDLSTSAALLRTAVFEEVGPDAPRPRDEDVDEDEATTKGTSSLEEDDTTTDSSESVESIRLRLDDELEATRARLMSKETPPALRSKVLLGYWNKAMGAFGSALYLLMDTIEDDPVMAVVPAGAEALALLKELEVFYDTVGVAVDDALEAFATGAGSAADVSKAATAALAGFKARPALKNLEGTSVGTPALYSQQIEVLQGLIDALS